MPADERPFAHRVADVVRSVPPGTVVTYGEVAAEAGSPGAARAVGRALAAADGLPWWRVVPASGRLAVHLAEEQGRRLEAEGVAVVDGRIRPG